jgi:hypothetical protein
MRLLLPLLSLALVCTPALAAAAAAPLADVPTPAPFLVLDMVYPNPGEPAPQTQFLDPALLARWGFNGNVPREFIQCAVTFDDLDPDILAPGSPDRAWVEKNALTAERHIAALKAAGQPSYPFTDFIVLPKRLVAKYKTEILDEKGRIDIHRPKTREILIAQIDGIFKRFPDLAGLTLRHGETYLHDTPFHTGGNPILRGEESHVTLLEILRDEICVKRNKTLLYRTWDFGHMHDRADYYLAITNRIEPHPKLLFSIKHQQGDYHRLTRFNPCLGLGRHRQIVEVQCQLEAYGKGAFPYYVGQGVIDGWEEYATHLGPKGLRDLNPNPLFAGVWTWSRGGGWAGPRISHELWLELNTYVVAKWAQNRHLTEEYLFNEYAREKLGLRDWRDLDRLRRLALLSAQAVLRSQNSLVHKLDVWWNRDEYFRDLSKDLQPVARSDKADAFLREKADATAMWREIEAISRELTVPDARTTEFIRVSSTYGRIKAAIIEQMCRALIFSQQAQPDAARVAEALRAYDALWSEWRQLRADHPDTCATLYTDRAFGDKPGMGAALEKLRLP